MKASEFLAMKDGEGKNLGFGSIHRIPGGAIYEDPASSSFIPISEILRDAELEKAEALKQEELKRRQRGGDRIYNDKP